MKDIDKSLEKVLELIKEQEIEREKLINDPNTPDEIKKIIEETRNLPNQKTDLNKKIKRINPDTFEIEYE